MEFYASTVRDQEQRWPGAVFSRSLWAEFDKWAAVEVSGFDNVPDGMDTLAAPAGLYAVFQFEGPAKAA